MGDWALGSGERQETSTAVASRGAANAKGSYVQLIASTSFQYSALQVQLDADGGGGQTYLVDIAVGAAASEVIVIPDILLDSIRSIHTCMIDIIIPISVPAGTRISCRCQETGGAGTRTVNVTVIGRSGGANYAPSAAGSAVNYGAISASTNGVLIDSGAVLNTYGAWTEITPATSRDHSGLMVVLGTNKQSTALVDSSYYFQIGVGAAAAETQISEFMSSMTTGADRLCVNTMNSMFQVPSGTRLSMRSKCVLSGAAGARNTTAIILGY